MKIETFNPETGAIEELDIDMKRPWAGPVPTWSVVPNPTQPRKYFDEVEGKRMKESLEHDEDSDLSPELRKIFPNQEEAVSVMAYKDESNPKINWMVKEGERRFRGIRANGYSAIQIVYSPRLTKDKLFRASFKANWNRLGHTHIESAEAINKLRKEGLTYEQISRIAGKESPAWASNEHKLLNLHPNLQVLLDAPTPKPKRLPFNTALLLAKYSHPEQLEHWRELEGTPKGQMYHKARTSLPDTSVNNQLTGRPRRPSDDRDYVKGRLSHMLRVAKNLSEIDGPLLTCFEKEDVDMYLKFIKAINISLLQFGIKLAQMGKPSELTDKVLARKRESGNVGKASSVKTDPIHTQSISYPPRVSSDKDEDENDPEGDRIDDRAPSRLQEALEIATRLKERRARQAGLIKKEASQVGAPFLTG